MKRFHSIAENFPKLLVMSYKQEKKKRTPNSSIKPTIHEKDPRKEQSISPKA
jgi:hypothetical protein